MVPDLNSGGLNPSVVKLSAQLFLVGQYICKIASILAITILQLLDIFKILSKRKAELKLK